MKIAVEGCAHGELEKIYNTIKEVEKRDKITVDLLICCGDFQSSRNVEDLNCMAIPHNYRSICTFYKYFSGEEVAPILTIFIGGNHEASNYLQELTYGGWVAPKIYYLGNAGVINIAGIRIGGLSGIYKSQDYFKGKFEKSPYNENTKRSVYHIRNLEVFRLKQLSQPMDVFLSHDWPTGVYNYGDTKKLLKIKPYFEEDIESNQLGSKPCMDLLKYLKPKYWFSAHLHCKFSALIPHEDDNQCTKFLALDKCLPKRKFLQIVNLPHDENKKIELEYDLEWLTILFLTNHLLSVKNTMNFMPGPGGNERYQFTPDEADKNLILSKFNNTLTIPDNFQPTASAYQLNNKDKYYDFNKQPNAQLNPQTIELCEILSIDDPMKLLGISNFNTNFPNRSLSENYSSFTSDTVHSDYEEIDNEKKEVITTTGKKLTPIKLPQPKMDDYESSGNLDTSPIILNNFSEELDKSLLLSEDLIKPSPKRLNNSETVEESSTLKKVFKRRNADIYNAEENNS